MEENRTSLHDNYSYEVVYEEKGVTIIFSRRYSPEDKVLPPEVIFYDLNRRGISGIKPVELMLCLGDGGRSFTVAGPQEMRSVDSSAFVSIDKKNMSAIMWLLPPAGEGREKTAEELLEQIRKEWRVAYGVDEAKVREWVEKKRYFVSMGLATGTEPVDGVNGYIEILFKTDHSAAPKEREDGTVDFKELDIFSSVTAGDKLAVCVPAVMGKPGKNVLGEELAAKNGKEAPKPKGKNIQITEDGAFVVASKSGRVDLVNGRIEVSDVYVVDSDVDFTVGNIDFDGDVEIRGNVMAGITINATGNIEIVKTVEAAKIIAGKDIILHKGMQGVERGLIKAEGNVSTSFLERCIVVAKGDVNADYIMHSDVSAHGKVILGGRRGKLIGGITRAGHAVSARTIGTPSGEKTIIEIGAPMELKNLLKEHAAKMAQYQEQIDKIASMERIYSGKESSEGQQEMWEKLREGKKQLEEALEEEEQLFLKTKEKIDALSGGAIHIHGEAFHNVRISIDSVPYTIDDTLEYSTIKCHEGEIRITACESRG